jgi:periplasmic protein TonB
MNHGILSSKSVLSALVIAAACAAPALAQSTSTPPPPDQIEISTTSEIKTGDETPDPEWDAFLAVDVQPNLDLAALQSSLLYPKAAAEAGIEGTVIVRVLIGVDGKPLRSMIDSSPSPLLNPAAVSAVMAATFTPAQMEGKPLKAWVSVPVRFKL